MGIQTNLITHATAATNAAVCTHQGLRFKTRLAAHGFGQAEVPTAPLPRNQASKSYRYGIEPDVDHKRFSFTPRLTGINDETRYLWSNSLDDCIE